ncbi:hypothetical protein EJ04DRAFT_567205 [Polyplosphaeria fusca]|uniref:F-box domain-containing protein n=1 Tax=Polyplosphaeria fusca TaxID=682080 RepID=A0A9P4UWG0_9PLEO|nr:hypothetical protein EJ04DRAFT_567205 [Polyplosphaeria fusca]
MANNPAPPPHCPLPAELLILIIHHSPPPALSTLSRTSRGLHAYIRPHLWSHPDITINFALVNRLLPPNASGLSKTYTTTADLCRNSACITHITFRVPPLDPALFSSVAMKMRTALQDFVQGVPRGRLRVIRFSWDSRAGWTVFERLGVLLDSQQSAHTIILPTWNTKSISYPTGGAGLVRNVGVVLRGIGGKTVYVRAKTEVRMAVKALGDGGLEGLSVVGICEPTGPCYERFHALMGFALPMVVGSVELIGMDTRVLGMVIATSGLRDLRLQDCALTKKFMAWVAEERIEMPLRSFVHLSVGKKESARVVDDGTFQGFLDYLAPMAGICFHEIAPTSVSLARLFRKHLARAELLSFRFGVQEHSFLELKQLFDKCPLLHAAGFTVQSVANTLAEGAVTQQFRSDVSMIAECFSKNVSLTALMLFASPMEQKLNLDRDFDHVVYRDMAHLLASAFSQRVCHLSYVAFAVRQHECDLVTFPEIPLTKSFRIVAPNHVQEITLDEMTEMERQRFKMMGGEVLYNYKQVEMQAWGADEIAREKVWREKKSRLGTVQCEEPEQDMADVRWEKY